MDGFSVCTELRRNEKRLPVVMLTARGAVSDPIRGLDAGADDYLVKPFDFGELLARLRAPSSKSHLGAGCRSRRSRSRSKSGLSPSSV